MNENKRKFGLWVHPETLKKVDSTYKEDNCKSRSEFIENAINFYCGYIAMRPRVEKQGSHGLFSQTDEPIVLSKVAEEVANHDGTVWTNVLSLR